MSLKTTSGRYLDNIQTLRTKADQIILDLWNQIEGHFAELGTEAMQEKSKDFGKMRTNATEFDPGNIHFAIFSFTKETIESTIDLFYKRVRELTK